jgi:hypothetical protein
VLLFSWVCKADRVAWAHPSHGTGLPGSVAMGNSKASLDVLLATDGVAVIPSHAARVSNVNVSMKIVKILGFRFIGLTIQ